MVHRNKKRTKQAPLGKYLSPAGLEELKQYKSATGTHKYDSNENGMFAPNLTIGVISCDI